MFFVFHFIAQLGAISIHVCSDSLIADNLSYVDM